MSDRQYSQIAFMPYAPIDESFTLGNFDVWPFYKECRERINDERTVQHLEHNFSRYVEWEYRKTKGGFDKILSEIIMITPKGFKIGLEIFSEQELEEIRSISHIIAFTAISELSFGSNSSDPFILYMQNFRVGFDGIGVWNKYFTSLEMVKFMKPYYIDTGLIKYKPTDLCRALGKALSEKNNPQMKQIFRSLELFYHTATNNEMITAEHRLLSLIMCFEVLLKFDGKVEFAKKLEKLLEYYKPQMETRIIKSKNTEKSYTAAKTSWWAYDLYNLRNSIVHGDDIDWEITKYGNVWTRIEFASILLRKLIKKLLLKERLWSTSFAESLIEAESLDETLERLIKDFNDTYVI